MDIPPEIPSSSKLNKPSATEDQEPLDLDKTVMKANQSSFFKRNKLPILIAGGVLTLCCLVLLMILTFGINFYRNSNIRTSSNNMDTVATTVKIGPSETIATQTPTETPPVPTQNIEILLDGEQPGGFPISGTSFKVSGKINADYIVNGASITGEGFELNIRIPYEVDRVSFEEIIAINPDNITGETYRGLFYDTDREGETIEKWYYTNSEVSFDQPCDIFYGPGELEPPCGYPLLVFNESYQQDAMELASDTFVSLTCYGENPELCDEVISKLEFQFYRRYVDDNNAANYRIYTPVNYMQRSGTEGCGEVYYDAQTYPNLTSWITICPMMAYYSEGGLTELEQTLKSLPEYSNIQKTTINGYPMVSYHSEYEQQTGENTFENRIEHGLTFEVSGGNAGDVNQYWTVFIYTNTDEMDYMEFLSEAETIAASIKFF